MLKRKPSFEKFGADFSEAAVHRCMMAHRCQSKKKNKNKKIKKKKKTIKTRKNEKPIIHKKTAAK